MIGSCRVSSGQTGSFWTLRCWPGTWCRDCPLRERCTTCKTGRKLVLHERDDLLRQARADWAASSGLREDYMTHRPNVERAVAQVATWRGRRLKLQAPRPC